MSSPNSVIVTQKTNKISVAPKRNSVFISASGPQGIPGPVGPSGGDPTEYDFINVSSFTINHGLGRYPPVVVIIGGEEVDVDVTYVDVDNISFSFPTPQTGKVIYI